MPETEPAADTVAKLAASLLALPAPPGQDHRELTAATARCLCTTLRLASGSGEDGFRLALRLVEALDGLLAQASERNLTTEAQLTSLVSQLEQWTRPSRAGEEAAGEEAAAEQQQPAEQQHAPSNGAPEAAAEQLLASVAEQREEIRRALLAEDSELAAALQRRHEARSQARGGGGASLFGSKGGRLRSLMMGLVIPVVPLLLSVLVHQVRTPAGGAV